MWHWLDVHPNRLVQKEELHGEQDKGRYEKQDKAGLRMTEEGFFCCTNITERTGCQELSEAAVFFSVSLAEGHSGNARLLQPFFQAHFSPNGDFGPVQARGRLQYIHLMSSTACIGPGERATNPLLLKTTATKSKGGI